MGTHLLWGGPMHSEWVELEGLPATVCIRDRVFGRKFDYAGKKLLVFRNGRDHERYMFWVYIWGELPRPQEVSDCIKQADAWQHGRLLGEPRPAWVPLVCLHCGWRPGTEPFVHTQDGPDPILSSSNLLVAACPRCGSLAGKGAE